MRESGYKFKKGYSRSSKKRMKVDKDERQREISHIKSMLSNIENQLQVKQSIMEKAKSVKDFKLCDQLSDSVRTLLCEKHKSEKQLAAFKKIEAKSSWYHKRKVDKGQETVRTPPEKVKKGSGFVGFFNKSIPKDDASGNKSGHDNESANSSRDDCLPEPPTVRISHSAVVDATTVAKANDPVDDEVPNTEESEHESTSDTLILSPASSPPSSQYF